MKTVDVGGARIPALGFETWQLEGDDCRAGVENALDLGYRHIDTAQIYGNEAEVGEAIQGSEVAREDIWLTTKVWYERATAAQVKSSTEESLRKLRTGYVDLLLFHWPNDRVELKETLGAMNELREQGLAKHIGVSNFTPTLLKQALEIAPVRALQCEYHPFLAQKELIALCADNDMMFTAYSPLARGEVLEDPTLRLIAERHGKSTVQVVLRWLVDQPHVAAVPKASSEAHRRANFDIFDFSLTDADVAAIDGLARGQRIIDPGFAPKWENASA